MHHRYIGAPPPELGDNASAAYRLRLLFLDCWNLWRRLTRYRQWKGVLAENAYPYRCQPIRLLFDTTAALAIWWLE